MADYKIDDTVDITDVVCPVTFVKAKVALEELDDGQILAAGTICDGPMEILHGDCVKISYPNFYQDLYSLGDK